MGIQSELHMAKRIDCRTGLENAFHWAVLGLGQSEDGEIYGKVGDWGFELCFGFSQVRRSATPTKDEIEDE